MGNIIVEAVRKAVATRRHKSAAVWHRAVDNYPTSPQTTTTPWSQIARTAGRFQRNTAEIMTATKKKRNDRTKLRAQADGDDDNDAMRLQKTKKKQFIF